MSSAWLTVAAMSDVNSDLCCLYSYSSDQVMVLTKLVKVVISDEGDN